MLRAGNTIVVDRVIERREVGSLGICILSDTCFGGSCQKRLAVVLWQCDYAVVVMFFIPLEVAV